MEFFGRPKIKWKKYAGVINIITVSTCLHDFEIASNLRVKRFQIVERNKFKNSNLMTVA